MTLEASEDARDVAAPARRSRPATTSMCCWRSEDGKDVAMRLTAWVRRGRERKSSGMRVRSSDARVRSGKMSATTRAMGRNGSGIMMRGGRAEGWSMVNHLLLHTNQNG
jgi:hypothetical protein